MDHMYKDKWDFIRRNKLATICLVDDNGKPYGATMYYLYDDNKLKFIAARDTYKFKLIKDNPSICVVICDEDALSQVTIRGVVSFLHKPIEEDLYSLMNKFNPSSKNMIDIPLFHLDGPKIIVELDLNLAEVKLDKFRSSIQNIQKD